MEELIEFKKYLEDIRRQDNEWLRGMKAKIKELALKEQCQDSIVYEKLETESIVYRIRVSEYTKIIDEIDRRIENLK